MSEGAIMMIVDNHPNTYSSVQSYSHYLSVPTLVPSGRGSSAYDPYRYDISLLPPTIDAIVAVINHFQWNRVYYLFDTNDGLLRLQKLYESFTFGDRYTPVIRARRTYNVSDCYELLRRIDQQEEPPKRVILDLSSRDAYEKVLQQIVDVGMNREGYHYILGGLSITELDLSTFVYGGVNITGFSIIDNATRENAELIDEAQKFDIHSLGEITTDKALVIDTVHVLLLALKNLNEENSQDDIYTSRSRDRDSRNRYYRKGNNNQDSTCCNCSGDPLKQRFDGELVLKKLKNVHTYGLTGNIEFDEEGVRKNYIFKVHQLEHKRPLREVGFWTPKGGFNTSLPMLERIEEPTSILNRTLRVVTIKRDPFVQYKKTDDNGAPRVDGKALEREPFVQYKKSDDNGAPQVNGRYLEGYCIDLMKAVHEYSRTPFDYKIDLVGDDTYGKSYPNKGCWDGMIGELMDTHGCPNGGTRKKADIAIAPLTITEERQRVVDFTKPFMQTGISIMIKKPDKDKPGVFSFMYPLSNYVWLCVMIAFVAVSLVLFLVGRWSPYEWSEPDPKGGAPINTFTLFNTFWFSLGALMQQGSDTFPRSYSGRIVGSAWWFFTLILISSYTANLAAFLTIERLTPPIDSVDDLVNQNKIEYGTLKSGSSVLFFSESKVDVYRRMWQFMDSNRDRVLMSNVMDGVENVRTSKGNYAFMLESSFNNYHNQRKPCNTMKVGNNLDNKDYGLATPMNFYLRDQLNLAVLQLREVGELIKLEQKWWYSKGMCGTDKKDASTNPLTLSNVSGIFHILVGGLVLSMVVALCEYLIHQKLRKMKEQRRAKKMKPLAVRIVKKQTLEALKEVGYSDRETSGFSEHPQFGVASSAAPLVTFDSGNYSQHATPVH